jgi:ribosome-associated translation inhibitor RaiA
MKTKPSPRRSSSPRRRPVPTEPSVPPVPAAAVPIQTSFRDLPSSPALVARIEAEVGKLRRCFDGITFCRVVVVAPHRHHRSGRRYALRIELGVPRERLVITHQPPTRAVRAKAPVATKRDEPDAAHKDALVAIRDAFDAARRQLKEYVRRLRGDVKVHLPAGRPDSDAA